MYIYIYISIYTPVFICCLLVLSLIQSIAHCVSSAVSAPLPSSPASSALYEHCLNANRSIIERALNWPIDGWPIGQLGKSFIVYRPRIDRISHITTYPIISKCLLSF